MKYKVGDKVRIKSLEVLQCNPRANESGLMNRYCGQIAEVTSVIGEGIYKLDIDQKDRYSYGWCWYEDMLEDIDVGGFAHLHSVWSSPTALTTGEFVYLCAAAISLLAGISKKEEHPINLIGEHKFLTLKVKS